MPAAAVIPAPLAYIKAVAVKKLVVGSGEQAGGTASLRNCLSCPLRRASQHAGCSSMSVSAWPGTLTLKKLECSKQAVSPE